MRRIVLIATGLLAAAMLIALPAIGSNGSSGTYELRGIFDNGSFVVSGEQVRVAGANVGTVQSVDVTNDTEIASLEGGPHAVPGKAVVVMDITDPGFKDFRTDGSCIIRPQSLIGEKYIDCTPTQPRSPNTPPPPELSTIPDGQPGAGQHLLPLENNGKTVDLDLIQNINRQPFVDRFRIILNDLGAGLAGRGQDLGEVIDRADPALRETDRVLAILASQNQQLASLAQNGDTVLAPLAQNRVHITNFFHNAAIAGQATAERSPALQEGLQKLPRTLHQVRLTFAKLKQFGAQGAPLFTDLNRAAGGISKATVNLPAFATNAIPALTTLGTAAQSSGPKLVQADPVLSDLATSANAGIPVGTNFGSLLDTFQKTNGFQYLTKFIYNTVGSSNGFDQFGHFLRSNLQLSSCVEIAPAVQSGCEATFKTPAATTTKKKKKKKKSKKATLKASGVGASSPIPQIDVPPIQQLIPQLQPSAPDQSQPAPPPADQGTTTTTPTTPSDQSQPSQQNGPSAQARARLLAALGPSTKDMSLQEANLFLQFLLGGQA
jgi:phospholipid/cholesterol/gamma-HCH transport system substrate-binding protein